MDTDFSASHFSSHILGRGQVSLAGGVCEASGCEASGCEASGCEAGPPRDRLSCPVPCSSICSVLCGPRLSHLHTPPTSTPPGRTRIGQVVVTGVRRDIASYWLMVWVGVAKLLTNDVKRGGNDRTHTIVSFQVLVTNDLSFSGNHCRVI